eukprot:5848694-Alexandrium_andersonii.AAC.1
MVVRDVETDSESVLLSLKAWACQAPAFTRQRTHLHCTVVQGCHPPSAVLDQQMAALPIPPVPVPTDVQLDSEEAALANPAAHGTAGSGSDDAESPESAESTKPSSSEGSHTSSSSSD